jgi:hypothetical protein
LLERELVSGEVGDCFGGVQARLNRLQQATKPPDQGNGTLDDRPARRVASPG